MDPTTLFQELLEQINNQIAQQNNSMLRINTNNQNNVNRDNEDNIENEGLRTPESRPRVDRYNTATSVDKVVNGITRQVKWFSDFQMAWIWIDNEVKREIQNGDDRDWRIKSFHNAADSMDEYWQDDNEDGVTVARTTNTTGVRVKYVAFYDPGETQAIRAYQERINREQQQDPQLIDPPQIPRLNLNNLRRI